MVTRSIFVSRKSLIVILFIAAILRLWKLGTIPPHLTPDEAALGYNAYSILKTGRDEYGEFLPIILKSFGDYKPGLYVYLTAPFIAVFGLNEFTVRLPSAIAGVISVYLLFLIANELFKDKKFVIWPPAHRASWLGENLSFGIWPALLLALSPWHIHFSRGAWEANVSLTLTLAGIYFFLKALETHKNLLISAIFFALTYVVYQGAKLATTIPIFILAVVYWKELLKFDRKVIAKSVIVGLIICSPIIFSFLGGKTGRLEVFSVFSYRRPTKELSLFLSQGSEKIGDFKYYLFHPEGLNFARGILGRWFNHFSGQFLFFEGDWQNPRHSAPSHGMLLLADLVLLIVGFVFSVRHKSKAAILIFLWLILAPLPAALSRDQVHAVRALNMVIPLTIVSAIGLSSVLFHLEKLKRLRVVSYTLIFTFYLLAFTYFLDAYFVHLPTHNARRWFYGYKQVVYELAQMQRNYEAIKFQQSYNQPYTYFLFHQKYEPLAYQKQARLVEGGVDVGLVERLDNISFEFFSWPVAAEKGTLIVGDSIVIPDDFSKEDYKLISEIKYPDGLEIAFRILEVQ